MLVEKTIIVSIPKLQKYVVDETSLEDGLRLGSVQDLAETQKSIFLFHKIFNKVISDTFFIGSSMNTHLFLGHTDDFLEYFKAYFPTIAEIIYYI